MEIVLKNCRFIPELTQNYEKSRGDILIKDGYIASISENISPDGREIFDLKDNILMPGLIDLHTHFVQWDSNSGYEALTMNSSDAVFLYYKHAMSFLEQGFTTIRDCGSDFRAVNSLAKAIRNGIVKGPRVISSGLIVTPTETGNQTYSGMYNEADGVDEIIKACREEFKEGADYIKIMTSGAFMNAGGAPKQPIITKEELDAAVMVAKMKNSYVGAHCHSRDAILMAIESGVRTVEHGSFIDNTCIDLLLKTDKTFIVPTMSTMLYYEKSGDDKSEIRASSPKFELKKESFINLAKGHKAGLKYGWGTDVTLEIWENNPAYEFNIRKEYFKCSNVELLKQATIYSAEILGIGDIIGSIAIGKKADLISLTRNPVDDLSVMAEKPSSVWVGGEKLI